MSKFKQILNDLTETKSGGSRLKPLQTKKTVIKKIQEKNPWGRGTRIIELINSVWDEISDIHSKTNNQTDFYNQVEKIKEVNEFIENMHLDSRHFLSNVLYP